MTSGQQHKRRWRDYETPSGARPVKDYIQAVARENISAATRIVAAMKEVEQLGTIAARHLRGDIWEVRISGEGKAFRVLFATEGRHSQVLLALEGFTKKTRTTPPELIALAEERLRDWRERGAWRQR